MKMTEMTTYFIKKNTFFSVNSETETVISIEDSKYFASIFFCSYENPESSGERSAPSRPLV